MASQRSFTPSPAGFVMFVSPFMIFRYPERLKIELLLELIRNGVNNEREITFAYLFY